MGAVNSVDISGNSVSEILVFLSKMPASQAVSMLIEKGKCNVK